MNLNLPKRSKPFQILDKIHKKSQLQDFIKKTLGGVLQQEF
jgi:hypothetical protein